MHSSCIILFYLFSYYSANLIVQFHASFSALHFPNSFCQNLHEHVFGLIVTCLLYLFRSEFLSTQGKLNIIIHVDKIRLNDKMKAII